MSGVITAVFYHTPLYAMAISDFPDNHSLLARVRGRHRCLPFIICAHPNGCRYCRAHGVLPPYPYRSESASGDVTEKERNGIEQGGPGYRRQVASA